MEMADPCRKHWIRDAGSYDWKAHEGLESENAQLKKLLAKYGGLEISHTRCCSGAAAPCARSGRRAGGRQRGGAALSGAHHSSSLYACGPSRRRPSSRVASLGMPVWLGDLDRGGWPCTSSVER